MHGILLHILRLHSSTEAFGVVYVNKIRLRGHVKVTVTRGHCQKVESPRHSSVSSLIAPK